MKIFITSVFVDDQEKAVKFYTEILGFVKKEDISMGQYRWLTVVSPDEPKGTELLLEPNNNSTAKEYQKGLLPRVSPRRYLAWLTCRLNLKN